MTDTASTPTIPLEGQDLQDAMDYNRSDAPDPEDIPQGARADFPGLNQNPRGGGCDQESFAKSTQDLQLALDDGLKPDGKYGPSTAESTWKHYDQPPLPGDVVPWERYKDVQPNRRNGLFLDFGGDGQVPHQDNQRRFVSELARAQFTDVYFGCNQVGAVKDPPNHEQSRFVWLQEPARYISFCQMCREYGIEGHFLVWMSPGDIFMEELVSELAPVVNQARAASVMGNAEKNWTGKLPGVEAGQDEASSWLAANLLPALDCPFGTVILYFVTPKVRSLVGIGAYCCLETYAFREPDQPDTMEENYNPGFLQWRTALDYHQLVQEGIRLLHGQAAYKQFRYAVEPEVAMLTSASASQTSSCSSVWWSLGNVDPGEDYKWHVFVSLSPEEGAPESFSSWLQIPGQIA